MTDRVFFLFPGQGSQYSGMALDLLEASVRNNGEKVKNLFSLVSEIYGADMEALLRDSEAETLKRTDVSQQAITLANLAACSYLAERGIKPSCCAGFSLGEYAALATAGIITEEDCFRLVTQRGKVMQAAIDRIGGNTEAPGMAAVLGLAPEKVVALVTEWKTSKTELKELYTANINSPRQTVVSGTAKALSQAEELFRAAGAKRFIRLAVAGPFHSPLMAQAAEEFGPFLEAIVFKNPEIPFFSNVSGKRVLSGEEAKKLALAHITKAVRWTDEEKAVTALGETEASPVVCLEVGPGKTLQGLWRDSGSEIPCYAAGTAGDIEMFLNEKKEG